MARDYNAAYASLPGFSTLQRSTHEKDADSVHPDSSRAAGNVHNNRTGRWWWPNPVVSARSSLPKMKPTEGKGW